MKTVVVIPTYNEKENVKLMSDAVLAQPGELEALFVDDNSPDGTGDVVDEIAKGCGRVHCLHRERKEGLGRAYVAGFAKALEMGADRVVQMDCDFSHDPADIARLVAEDADLVIGSRYVKGGSTPGWPFKRRLISRAGGVFIRVVTGMRIKDPTGGFKCWKAEALRRIHFESAMSAGYSFQLEMNHRAWKAGLSIREIPISFTDRTRGQSKITAGIAVESIKVALGLRFGRRARQGAAQVPGDGSAKGPATRGCVFDFGGVMTTTTMPERVKKLVDKLGIDWNILKTGFAKHRTLADADLITMDEMYDRIWADAGVEVSPENRALIVKEDFASFLYRNERTLEWMRSLKAEGFKIGILTNMCTEFAKLFREHFPDFIALADAMVISGEEHICKPSPEIYALLQKRIGLEPGELCFFDDVEANCDGARAAGWNAVRFTTTEETSARFRELLRRGGGDRQ